MFLRDRTARSPVPADEQRFRKALRWSTAVAAVAFVLLLWNFGPHPLRTAIPDGSFSGFYDDQAHAILRGHLHLEPGDAGIEAFVVDGKEYLYFPPGPALLRLPVAALTGRFDGSLTALSMLIAWTLLAGLSGRLLWEVRRTTRHDAPLGRWELGMFALLHGSLCGGSVVLFLASLPWVYHEAYMWSIALTVGALLAMIRCSTDPGLRRVVTLGAFTLGAIMVRTTAGWALAVTTLIFAGVAYRRRDDSELRRSALPLLVAGLVPLAAGIAVNWAKFRHPYLFPLDKQVFTQLNAQRQRALEANGGDLVSVRIAPTTLINYFRPDGIRVTPLFPFVTFPAERAPTYGGAVIDQSYRTGSVVAFAPLLAGLTVWGLVAMVATGTRDLLRPLRLPMLATLAAGGPVIFYGYLAYRYTSEFMPLLMLGSAIGLVQAIERWSARHRVVKQRVLGAMVALVAFGAYANGAAAVSTLHLASPGPDLERYVRLQLKLSDVMGHPLDDYIVAAAELPRSSRTDEIVVLGDCAASFVGTADVYGPWELLTMREWQYSIGVDPAMPKSGTSRTLAEIGDGPHRSTIGVDVEPGRYRAVVERPDETMVGDWHTITDDRFRLEVLVSTEYRVYSVEPARDEEELTVPVITFRGDLNFPNFLTPLVGDSQWLDVSAEPLPMGPLCPRLLAHARGTP